MVSGIASIKPHLSERAMISYLQRSHAKEIEVDYEKPGHVRESLSIKRGMSRKRYQKTMTNPRKRRENSRIKPNRNLCSCQYGCASMNDLRGQLLLSTVIIRFHENWQ